MPQVKSDRNRQAPARGRGRPLQRRERMKGRLRTAGSGRQGQDVGGCRGGPPTITGKSADQLPIFLLAFARWSLREAGCPDRARERGKPTKSANDPLDGLKANYSHRECCWGKLNPSENRREKLRVPRPLTIAANFAKVLPLEQRQPDTAPRNEFH